MPRQARSCFFSYSASRASASNAPSFHAEDLRPDQRHPPSRGGTETLDKLVFSAETLGPLNLYTTVAYLTSRRVREDPCHSWACQRLAGHL